MDKPQPADEDAQTGELRERQREREQAEQEQARSASDDQEAAQHKRRGEKAAYLRQKLDERAESERD
jgi:hypothetical protein